jgi:predicted transcriptional regulator
MSPITPEELKQIRKKLGLTQTQSAELVGVSMNSIARQERGELGVRESLARLIRMIAKQKLESK